MAVTKNNYASLPNSIVTVNEYEKEKVKFLYEHQEFEVHTCLIDENQYHKEYVCANGDTWYEIMKPITKEEVVEVNKCFVKINVNLFETEFWTSIQSRSKFCYMQGK